MPIHKFINKALFFPEKGILAIGDLHIGYDHMLRQAGILIPKHQVKDILSDFEKVFLKIQNRDEKIRKIIFLGDIKHSFRYEFKERDDFKDIFKFLKGKIPEKNIIFIKGNHDTMDYTIKKNMKPYHIERDIFFAHGHKAFPEMFDKKIKFVITGHLHPSIMLKEKSGAKFETYKCFLEGNYKKKKFVVLPSFLGFVDGTLINDYKEEYINNFHIIPKKEILEFKIYTIGQNNVYNFGKVRDLI